MREPNGSSPALRLVCQESERTGLPQLIDPSGRVSREALAAAQREVGQRYERLVAGGAHVATIDSLAAFGLPRRWKVESRCEPGRRCPTLIFEPVEEAASAAVVASAKAAGVAPALRASSDWRRAWINEVRQFCRRQAKTPEDFQPLEELFREIYALADAKPFELGLLLLAGYVRVAEAVSSQEGGGAEGYRAAAAKLSHLCSEMLPQGAVSTVESERDRLPAPSRRRWLERIFPRP